MTTSPKPKTKPIPRLLGCEVGAIKRTIFCPCGGDNWNRNPGAGEEDLTRLPADDPHHVPAEKLRQARVRRAHKQQKSNPRMIFDRHGRYVGEQMDVEDFDQIEEDGT